MATRDLLRRYLLFLNAPDAFAKRFGASDSYVTGYVRGWAAGERVQIARLRDVHRDARQLAAQMEKVPDDELEKLLLGRGRNLREERRLLRDIAEARMVESRSPEVIAAFEGAFPEHSDLSWPRLNNLIRVALALLEERAGLSSKIRARLALSGNLMACRRPGCGRVWMPPRSRGRPSDYCPSCRKRWTSQELWYQTHRKRRRKQR